MAWYPPAGLTYALLLAFGVEFTPAVTIALLISSLFVYRMPQPSFLLILWALIATFIYGLAAAFLRKQIRFDWHLRKLRDVGWFICTTVLVSALLAVLSVSSSAMTGAVPRAEVLRGIFDWWIGETIGVLTVTPFLLLFVIPGLKRFMEGQPFRLSAQRLFSPPTLSSIGQAAGIALTLYLVFGVPTLAEFHPLFLLSLPLIWIALMRGFKGISAALLALNSGVVLVPWLFRFAPVPLGELELLMIANCIVGLLMGAVVSDRKQADETLQQSEAKYRSIFNNAAEGIFQSTPEGKFLTANPAMAHILGFSSPEELIHERTDIARQSYLDPLKREEFKRLMEQQNKVSGYVYAVSCKDGSVAWVSETAQAVRDVTGRIVRYDGIFIDITERKHAEEALRASQRHYQNLAETSPVGIFYTDARGMTTYVNPRWCEISGLSAEEALGDGWLRAVHPDDRHALIAGWGDAVQEQKTSISEYRFLRPDGTIRCVVGQATLETSSDGKMVGYVGTATDITDRKQAEDALRKSEEKYRKLVDEVNDGFYMTDAAGVFTLANPALAQIYGFDTPEALLGRKFMDFIAPELLAGLGELTRSTMHTGNAPEVINGQIVRPDGTRAFIEVKAVSILQDSQIVGSQGVVRDVTDRKQAEDALRKSEEKYRSIFENIQDVYYETLFDGTVLEVSPSIEFASKGQYHREDLIGRSMYAFYADTKIRDAMISAIQKAGSVTDFEVMLKNRDNSLIPCSISAKIQFSAQGHPEKIIGSMHDISERKQKAEEIRSRTDELTTLYRLSRALADADDLENVIELVNRHAVESVHTTFACIALLEEGELVSRAVYPVRTLEYDFRIGSRQPIPSLPACQRVMEKNEPAILLAGSLQVSSAECAFLFLDFARSVCLVPLRVGGESQNQRPALGLLVLGEARDEKREPFTPEKIHLARSIGDQAASAIRRLLLIEQTGRRLQQLTALSDITRAISSTFDLHLILGLLLEHVTQQMGIDATDVLLLNPGLHTLEFSAGLGFRTKSFEKARLRLGEGYGGQAALKREIVHVSDLAEQHDNPRLEKHLADEQFVSYYGVPLIAKGEIKGVLEIFQRAQFEPDKEWLDFLGTLARQAAIAIDSVLQFDTLQRSNSELSQAYDETIEGWSYALDLRDKETEGHTRRVTEMTLKLARLFGLSETALTQVRRGALLHDIGKMGVPDGILLKPGPLTAEEWVVMKKHPTFAYEMLSPIQYLRATLDIPYCHHEKWDGTGYPRGLKGEQIPLAARIFAVVDVWDALISDRPYRPAWSEDKARQNIQAEAGTHFDPQVVKTFFLEHG